MTAAPAGAATRAAAAQALVRVHFGGESLRAVLPTLGSSLRDSRDRALAEACVFAACRGRYRYEALLACLLQQPLPRREQPVHALLAVGLAQLDALQMPPHAVVDACVGATRLLGRPRYAGLVNACLRRFLREQDALIAAVCQRDDVRLNHPPWLIDALRAAWGERADDVMLAAARPPPLWLRVNRRKVAPADYIEALRRAQFEVRADPDLPNALCLPQPPAARSLPGWEEGWASVQDGAAQRAALALAVEPGMRVLDACAAPGGKTAALLEACDDLDLLALDADQKRLSRMQPGLQRLGLHAQLRCADAAMPESWWDGRPFERILLDAPCSATGIIRRQPDIRWHRRASDIPELCAQQARLLDALWPLLAPGGRLVYATCSILPDENAQQIDAFLDRHPDARPLTLAAHFGQPAGHGHQRLPGDDDTDGFFIAAMQRV